jgi:flagellar protein FlbD
VIKLTRFNSDSKKGEFILNAEHIQTIEETPDTVITLMNDKKLIVEEPMEEVVRRVMKYRRALNSGVGVR